MRSEALQHPPDGRRPIRCAPGVDRARDDQPVDRTRHRHVVQAEPLGLLLVSRSVAHLLEPEHRLWLAAGRVHHAEPEAPVRERDDLIRSARPGDVTSRVRDDHDLELEPLGRVDRQQADRPAALLLGDGLELSRSERVLLADEADEAGDVRTTDRLVVASQAPELADVREPTCPVPAREHGEVVVVLAHDPLAQGFEPEAGRGAHEALVALEERAEEALVARGEPLRKRPLEPREQGAANRVATKKHERVVRHAHERRGEHGRERDVVVAVVEEAEVREQIDDLLLAEVAAPGRTVRRQPLEAQRLLVALGVRAGREEHDDLARLGLAGVDEVAYAARNAPRLSLAPVLGAVREARLVGDEQLDRMPEDWVRELGRCGERLIVVAEGVAEEVVHGRKDLRA